MPGRAEFRVQRPGPGHPINGDQQFRSRQIFMTERQWELYRLSVVKEAPETPHTAALISAIEHKLMTLGLEETTSRRRLDGFPQVDGYDA
jgi:hypothetical protein